MVRTPSFRIALLALTALLLVVPTAFAAKGGGGGKGGGKQVSMTGSLSLVLVNSPDAVPNYGEQVNFDVVTNAPWPFVDLDCSQSGAGVYHSTIGYYGGWPGQQNFTLSGWNWTGGAADCTARLYNSNPDSSTTTTLNTLSFHVDA